MPDTQLFSPTDASVVSTSEDDNISQAIVFRLATMFQPQVWSI